MDCEYHYDHKKDKLEVTESMIDDFEEHGYIIVRNVLDNEELNKLKEALEKDDGIRKHAYELNDGHGRKSKLCLWNHPGNDITGMVARTEKIAGTSGKLLRGEIDHFATKLMMKEARTGGTHVWHQDYGYWYKNGFLYPNMMTVFIAIDKCMKANGCLQILKGSHKCGRIEHVMVGGQTGADLDRVAAIQEKVPLLYVELNPGDALYFHSNLLHKSNKNDSEFRRWAFLHAFNRRDNVATIENELVCRPIDIVSNDSIRKCTNFTDMTGKAFLDPAKDHTVKI